MTQEVPHMFDQPELVKAYGPWRRKMGYRSFAAYAIPSRPGYRRVVFGKVKMTKEAAKQSAIEAAKDELFKELSGESD